MLHEKYLRTVPSTSALCLVAMIAACSGEKKESGESESAERAAAPAAAGAPSASATGDTIVIEMWTDGTGNYFKPNKVEAHPGDVLRYVLKVGVHNVHFLADSNKIKTGLPAASEMLQLPGQTYDLLVSMAPGEYYFQCDPHAALGMKGELEVEEED